MQMTKADFEIMLNFGSDKETVAGVLKENGFASVGAVPEHDRPRILAKALTRSRAFNRGARKAVDINAFAVDYWQRRAPGRDMPKDFASVAARAWDNFNKAESRPANAGADDDKAKVD